MPRSVVQLPPYPASGGPGTANQTDTYVGRYRQRVSDIQREIEACEIAFERALERADAAAATRSRIDQLASKGRGTGNR